MTTPTLINLPPPPSDPVTPSDMGPGTPNSTTTSMSELSTVAIKDGHRGHLSHHHNPMDAERADRISRLAGLERVATARQPSGLSSSSGLGAGAGGPPAQPSTGYFDAASQPAMTRERSTVGSASATGSAGGRTQTWASGSGSDAGAYDKMSEDTMDTADQEAAESSSTGGLSDEAASLVGFGEGARTPARQQGGAAAAPASPMVGKAGAGAAPSHLREAQTPPGADARMIDGMTYDAGVVDTVTRTPPPTATTTTAGRDAAAAAAGRRGLTGTETAERIMRERTEREDVAVADARAVRSPDVGPDAERGLGRFYLEGKQ